MSFFNTTIGTKATTYKQVATRFIYSSCGTNFIVHVSHLALSFSGDMALS